MNAHRIGKIKKGGSQAAGFPWLRVSVFIFACGFLVLALSPLPDKIWRKCQRSGGRSSPPSTAPTTQGTKDATPVSQKPAPAKGAPPVAPSVKKPTPPKPQTDFRVKSGTDIRKTTKGITLKTKVSLLKGDYASKERIRKDSYTASYELKIKLPKPSTTLESLEKVSPKLGTLLPGLKEAIPKAKVSSFFYQAYDNKANRVKLKATQLSDLMTQHNFYDCETILNLKHPKSGRRALLLQSEMDVVSDGSDGDRLPIMPAKITNSSYYQPMTSYGWRKTGKTPNPLITGWNGRIKKANAEIARKETSADRKAWLKARIKKIKREIQDMEFRSFLVAEYDPFIVMPINMVTSRGDKYAAHVGDYAVVIYKGKIYPTIVGDAGPSFKTGEASLRIAKQLNPRAGIYSRPVSDLTVTYLVFPGTAEKPFKAPDYAHWHQRCTDLLTDFGGLGKKVKLHSWKNTFPKIKPKIKPVVPPVVVPKKDKMEGENAKKDEKATPDAKASSDEKNDPAEKKTSPPKPTPQKPIPEKLPPGVTVG